MMQIPETLTKLLSEKEKSIPDESFFHIRLDSEGEIYQYKPDQKLSSKGGYTFYCFKHGSLLRWGVTKCHEFDNYDRHIGRKKSKGRALSKKLSFITNWVDVKDSKKLVYNLTEIMQHTKTSEITQQIIEIANRLDITMNLFVAEY